MKSLLSVSAFILILLSSCSSEPKSELKTTPVPMAKNEPVREVYPGIDFEALEAMDTTALRFARNSIYAQYGKIFSSKDLVDHFNNTAWYNTNPDYTDALLSERDYLLINTIKCWEEKKDKIWDMQIDLDGDGKDEICYFLQSNKEEKACLLINEHVHHVQKNWLSSDDEFPIEEAPEDWVSFTVTQLDINPEDKSKELVITQHQLGWEDPGKDNLIVSLVDNELVVAELSASDYNAGNITTIEGGLIRFQESFCPEHVKFFEIKEGSLSMTKEEISEAPEGGCPACFIAASKVSTGQNQYTLISELQRGDEVLTYNLETKSLSTTKIKKMRTVKHSALVQLYFDHDTITSTLDHPYYVSGKGWASFDPSKTQLDYSNYANVKGIEIGDSFLTTTDNLSELRGFAILEDEQITYTITELENGSTFFVNGILVGVESLEKQAIVY